MTDNILKYTIMPQDNYIYLREVLKDKMHFSHSLLTKLKQQHKIKVNGQATLTNYRVQPGDVVSVNIALEEQTNIVPQYMPLNIIYEDQDFLVVNKPAGMVVHPAKGTLDGTLANAVTAYWLKQGKSILFRPINRLDKDTSGLVLIGKSQYAHQAIFQQQKQGTVSKIYQAVVEGVVGTDKGCINLPIARTNSSSPQRSIDLAGKPATTNFTVIKRYRDFTLLALTLITGRTHQIRVHLSQSDHPICGDTLYGHPSPLISRQALHAGQLSFQHPRTGLPVRLEAPLPADILQLLDHIK